MISCSAWRELPYSAQALFSLISDIQSYPQFLPGWKHVHILEKSDKNLVVEQEINLFGLALRFQTIAALDPPNRLDIHAPSSASQPFDKFDLGWRLVPRSIDHTLLTVELTAHFRSSIFDRLANHLSPILLERSIDAFERRALQCYGGGFKNSTINAN